MKNMKFLRAGRLGFVLFLSVFLVFSAAGASGRHRDSKVKDDTGWDISDSSGDDGFDEEDNGGLASTHFKDDSDDTYEDDADSSKDQVDSKFKEDKDQDDQDTDSSDEKQDEDR